ncbi:hypothetical protein BKN38_00155 [Helicobacter sp. CLO-3]|uniref:FAD-binding and (Fe-S)-binding domain-containing protein n=1 Tax=unclassified Helicobacter TaxID=2593540 RepID=UPI0008053885|nr:MULTISPECIES: FAD-binding and (Fe-S)-binding domain-containing protein [unclassified Helicobacter]OBV28785.1 hypothetical protein BA723_01555 [Helicobacter sp. CLO-3]OHU85855.1 hypothetical protein BKN38_00155 [Helicobacter sp. CLO-3]
MQSQHADSTSNTNHASSAHNKNATLDSGPNATPESTSQKSISPDFALEPKYARFYEQARKFIGTDRVFADYLRRFAYGLDASCYRYIPKLVIWAQDEREIQELLRLSENLGVPLTFRAAGTSLSGQACSDSVLVVCAHFWKNISLVFGDSQENSASGGEVDSVDSSAPATKSITPKSSAPNTATKPTAPKPTAPESIWCDCGVIGADANTALKKYGKKIGPDPATINNAMIGGIFSNNSSGMCCGVKQNSYQTIKSVRVVLHDGFVLDTSARAAKGERVEDFLAIHSDKWRALQDLREKILQDESLSALIRKKFAIKNTTGYAINTLLDFDTPRDILNHIFIGAEGTLGFISRVEYECVEDFAHKACALLFYENLSLASKAVEILASHSDIVSAAEMMDYACLAISSKIGDSALPPEIGKISKGNCAILVQLEDNEKPALESKIAKITQALSPVPSLFGAHFSFDKKEQESWWKIRKALLPLSASARPSGATVITEDVCFEIAHFARGIENISALFERFAYEGIIFGHALSGNVHFIITPLLDRESEIARFGAFMEELAKMVASLGGSIKAEHGTGRMVAPFVELEWGAKAYEINKSIKAIFDPKGLINPDVIITQDSQIHLKNLKPASSKLIEDYLDACMECGFCEKICPSKGITLTPRQRIGVYREIARLSALPSKTPSEQKELEALQSGYGYFGVETCATCSMCATLCPLEIDTAKIALKKSQESNAAPTLKAGINRAIASFMSADIARMGALARFGVRSANALQAIVGKNVAFKLSSGLHNALGTPILPASMPRANGYVLGDKKAGSSRDSTLDSGAPCEVVYFSSCLNRIFAPNDAASDKRALAQVFESVCEKAGYSVKYPPNIQKLCCGKAHKNHPQAKDTLAKNAYEALLKASDNGRIPIVCDHSACSLELLASIREIESKGLDFANLGSANPDSCARKLRIYDMPAFVAKYLLERLEIAPTSEKIALYAPCSTRHNATKNEGWEGSMMLLANALSAQVCAEDVIKCCGFAGNKGFITPELNQSALKNLGKSRACVESIYADSARLDSGKDFGACGAESKGARESTEFCVDSGACKSLDSSEAQAGAMFGGAQRGFSSSSTCEIGLAQKSGFSWQHIIYLVDECAKPRV